MAWPDRELPGAGGGVGTQPGVLTPAPSWPCPGCGRGRGRVRCPGSVQRPGPFWEESPAPAASRAVEECWLRDFQEDSRLVAPRGGRSRVCRATVWKCRLAPPAPECAEDPSLALQLRAVGSRQPPWATVLDGLSPRRLPGRSRPGSCVWFSRFPVRSSPFMPMELRRPQGPSPGHAVCSSHLRKGHPSPGPRGGLSRATTGQGTCSGAVPLWAGAGHGLAEEAGGEGGG